MVEDKPVWFYADHKNAQHGPVVLSRLVELFSEGDIDGMTLIWSPDLPTWSSVTDVPQVKAAIQAHAIRDDDEDIGTLNTSLATQEEPSVPKQSTSTQIQPVEQVSTGASDTAVPIGTAEAQYMYAPAGASNPSGPVPKSALASLHAAEYIDDTTLVWTSGMAAWVPYKSVREEVTPVPVATVSGKKRKRTNASKSSAKNKPPRENPWIIVEGLPHDVTESAIAETCKVAGIIKLDYDTKLPKVIIQRHEDGLSATALVCFLKEPSVELAVTLLDGKDFLPEYKMRVKQAPLSDISAGELEDSKRSASGMRKLTAEEQRARIRALEQQAALSWAEEGDESLGLHVIVLKHMFTPKDVADPTAIQDLEEEILEEAEKFGQVSKITVHSTNPEGVVSIKFASAGAAAVALEDFKKRFFGGRKIECEYWDGITKFDVADKNEKARLDEFGAWLEGSDGSDAET